MASYSRQFSVENWSRFLLTKVDFMIERDGNYRFFFVFLAYEIFNLKAFFAISVHQVSNVKLKTWPVRNDCSSICGKRRLRHPNNKAHQCFWEKVCFDFETDQSWWNFLCFLSPRFHICLKKNREVQFQVPLWLLKPVSFVIEETIGGVSFA